MQEEGRTSLDDNSRKRFSDRMAASRIKSLLLLLELAVSTAGTAIEYLVTNLAVSVP